jgi:hypothetical protein
MAQFGQLWDNMGIYGLSMGLSATMSLFQRFCRVTRSVFGTGRLTIQQSGEMGPERGEEVVI